MRPVSGCAPALIAAAVVDEDDFEIADGTQDRLEALYERDECRPAVIDGNDDGNALNFPVHAELLPVQKRPLPRGRGNFGCCGPLA